MCVLPQAGVDAADTMLVCAPVTVGDQPWNALVYSNALLAAAGVLPAGTPGLMLVPFPNPTAAEEFGLVPYTDVAEHMTRLREVFKPDRRARGGGAARSSWPPFTVPVVRVGNYDVSVVPRVADLTHRVRWRRFGLAPPGEDPQLAARLAPLSDTRVTPADSAVLVAVLARDASGSPTAGRDGFCLLYPAGPGGHLWFPTAHEGKGEGVDALAPVYEYDVRLFTVGEARYSFGEGVGRPRCSVAGSCRRPLFPSSLTGVSSVDPRRGLVARLDFDPEGPLVCTHQRVEGDFTNHGVQGVWAHRAPMPEPPPPPPAAPDGAGGGRGKCVVC